MITWDDKFATGVERIDDQHRKLFQFTNQMMDDLRSGKGADVLGRSIAYLRDYAELHFSYEEGCMLKHCCPIADQNKKAHKKFLVAIRAYDKRFNESKDDKILLAEIHRFVEDWLVSHICRIDVQLKPCVPPEQGG